MQALIYHNPDCGTSRNTLAMIEASGEIPEIIEYLKNPPSRERLIWLLDEMAMPPRALLRRKGTPYGDLGLDDPGLSDDQLIDAMLAHPILINRPIVVTDQGEFVSAVRTGSGLAGLPDRELHQGRRRSRHIFEGSLMTHRADFHDLPNIDPELLQPIDIDSLAGPNTARHAPRILILYGSLRSRSYSRFLAEEAARLLRWFGCEVRLFDPAGLPLPDDAEADHPRVQALRERAT